MAIYKDSKSLNVTSNAKLAQSERHEHVTQEVPDSEGPRFTLNSRYFLLNLFLVLPM